MQRIREGCDSFKVTQPHSRPGVLILCLPSQSSLLTIHSISPLLAGLPGPHPSLDLSPISSLYSHPYAPHRACSPVPCLILCSGLTILYAAPSICLAVFHLWVFAHAASPSKNILLCSLFQLLLSLLAQSQWLFLQAVLQDFSLLHLYSVLTPDQMGSAIFPMLPPSLPVSFTSGF